MILVAMIVLVLFIFIRTDQKQSSVEQITNSWKINKFILNNNKNNNIAIMDSGFKKLKIKNQIPNSIATKTTENNIHKQQEEKNHIKTLNNQLITTRPTLTTIHNNMIIINGNSNEEGHGQHEVIHTNKQRGNITYADLYQMSAKCSESFLCTITKWSLMGVMFVLFCFK